MSTAVRIFGIDPGLNATGWGVIVATGNRLQYVASGRIRTRTSDTLASRLCQLAEALDDLILEYGPHEAAVEETFVNADPRSALKLGQARGVCLTAPARARLPVAEYAPNRIKKSVVGAGHADKNQIAMMVGRLLPAASGVKADEADALAVALCHAAYRRALGRISA